MHGGAPGSGAPLGNQNALKHGRYTRLTIAERKEVRNLIRFLSVHPLSEPWGDDVELPELPFMAELARDDAIRAVKLTPPTKTAKRATKRKK